MRRRTALVLVAAVAAAAVAAGIRDARQQSDDGPTPSRVAAERPCPESDEDPSMGRVAAGRLALRQVGTANEPTTVVFAPDGSEDGFLGERAGRVRRVAAGRLTDEVVIDVVEDTMQDGDGGLLALAYGPDGDWLYVYRSNAERDDVLTSYPLDDHGRPDPDASRDILIVNHPDSLQHHGGSLVFGRDGLLYIGLGDGGGLGDPRGNAQDPRSLLGKVLRIHPTPDEVEPYRIPADNPHVGDDGWAPEIWLLGVRNPFRMSLDAETGDLWLGDVGQSCWEELDRLATGVDGVAGANLGWDHIEGTRRFEGGTVPGRELRPTQVHPHGDGWCAIVAGYVPRSSAVPTLDGRLLYSDYCKGQLLALAVDDSTLTSERLLNTRLDLTHPSAIVPGPGGRPWVLSLDGRVTEITEQPG